MAIIPSYERKVRPIRTPDVQVRSFASPETAGAAFKGLSLLGQGLEERQAKQDTADIMNAKAEMTSRLTDLLYNKDAGLMVKQGSFARGVTDTFTAEFDKHFGDIRGKLSPRQQLVFDQHVRPEKDKYLAHVGEHENKQADVALADSLKNKVYNTAKLLSQPGAYLNKTLVDSSLADLETDIRAGLSFKKDKATLDRTVAEHKDAVLQSALATLYGQDDYKGVEQFIGQYGNAMNPESTAKYQGWARERKKNEDQYKIINALTADPNFTVEGAMATLRGKTKTINGGVPVDKSQWRLSGDPDVDNLTPAAQAGISKILGQLNSKDPGVAITSGYRDPERNRRAGGVENSKHIPGDAADFVFSRAMTKEEQDEIESQVRDAGWQNVLWHDAGSGYHLHVDTYKGESGGESKTVPLYSEEELYRFEQQFKAEERQRKAERREAEREAYNSFLDGLYALDGNPVAQLKLIDEANIPTAKKMAHRKAIENPLKAAELKANKDAALGGLSSLHSKKVLTRADVDTVAEYLDQKTRQEWYEKARKSEQGIAQTANDAADNQWIQYLESSPAYKTMNDKEQKAFIGGLVAEMNNDGLQKQDRYTYATDRIANSNKYKNFYVNTEKRQAENLSKINEIHGSHVAYLVNLGWTQELNNNEKATAPDYAETLRWLEIVEEQKKIEGKDGPTQKAWDITLKNGSPLEKDLFWNKRNEIAAKMGWEKEH